ncbi:MAG: ABC transporter substrate-binding protein [Alphaproteobacteria bacterium]
MLMKKTWLLAAMAAAGMTTMGLAASPASAQQQQKVTYLLPAPVFLPAFAPWMLAKHKGYYKAEGLDVEFQSGKGGVDTAKQVGAGNADIGGGVGDTAVIVRPNDIPVKAVAVLGGKSLALIVVHADSGINSPKDLKGKKVSAQSLVDTTYYALLGTLASQGLTKNDVEVQPVGPVNVWKIFAGKQVDAMVGVPDFLASAETAGAKVKVFPTHEYFENMAQAIIASDDMIKKNPEMIRKVVRATLMGMADIMKDPAQATKDYIAAVPQHKGKEEEMGRVLSYYAKFVYPGQKTIGEMDEARLTKLQEFYLKQGIIQKATPVKDLYSNAFIK